MTGLNRFWFVIVLFLSSTANAAPAETLTGQAAFGDWQKDYPGLQRKILPADLPPPYQTDSAGNSPKEVRQPDNAMPKVPDGFTIKLFAKGFDQPRLMRTAPNGDIFLAETGGDQVRVLRFAEGAAKPEVNEVFATGLNQPFGIAFYPSGAHPEWVYVANTDSIIRFAYQAGDLKARGEPQVIVPHLPANGGHSTRDIAFSADGSRMFVSVGSASNVADDMPRKTVAFIKDWQAKHGVGAAWDDEKTVRMYWSPSRTELTSIPLPMGSVIASALRCNQLLRRCGARQTSGTVWATTWRLTM